MKKELFGKILIGVGTVSMTFGIIGLSIRIVNHFITDYPSKQTTSNPANIIASQEEFFEDELVEKIEENPVPMDATEELGESLESVDTADASNSQSGTNGVTQSSASQTSTVSETNQTAESNTQTTLSAVTSQDLGKTNGQTNAQAIMQQGTSQNEIIVIETGNDGSTSTTNSNQPSSGSGSEGTSAPAANETPANESTQESNTSTENEVISYELPFVPAH